jgi:hypothetical protein
MDSYIEDKIQSFMELSPEDKRCYSGAIVFQVTLIAFILMVFAKALCPSEPFSQNNKTIRRICVLCECRCNKDNKCETHMCQKIHDALRVYAEQKCYKANLASQSMGFAINCDGEWNSSDFFSDILKNEPEIKGKITKYLEKNIETRITVDSVKRMLEKDLPM